MTVSSATLTTGTVAEAMTPGILTCLPVTPLRVVAQMMATHRVHAIVVFGHEDSSAAVGCPVGPRPGGRDRESRPGRRRRRIAGGHRDAGRLPASGGVVDA